MVEVKNEGMYLISGDQLIEAAKQEEAAALAKRAGVIAEAVDKESARKNTIAGSIMVAHNSGTEENYKLRFDALTSHDITFVGIIQTAIASGMQSFPVPYVLTNCHNSLCAVGGTINEDDHVFGLTAAQKYGGIYVPAHQAVIHQYNREMMTGCGKMILGSDSHTRYGALGTMAIGEGGPELVKQLLGRTYDVPAPEVIAIYLEGAPRHGVGPQDVALALIRAVFANGFVKNKVLEFVGPGVANLSMDFRNGIDVMTTESTCLSSIWRTDATVAEYYRVHGRAGDYKELNPGAVAYYDGAVRINLDTIEPMIALPFHPSNGWTIREFQANAADILRSVEQSAAEQLENPNIKVNLVDKLIDGKMHVEQGVIVGCSGGTFENIELAAQILNGKSIGSGEFALSIYPQSQPVFTELVRSGAIEKLMVAGATVRSAFCGPCFGAGDTPANQGFSIRHATRNFPNREGSKPGNGQIATVALMDARSIAATAANGGVLTSAADIDYTETTHEYHFNPAIYAGRVYNGFGKAQPETAVKYGPGIAPWPQIRPLPDNLLLSVAAVIHDPVTTTDELIPSGETSSFRSNPYQLAEFTLSRKEPAYVGRAKAARTAEQAREAGEAAGTDYLAQALGLSHAEAQAATKTTGIGSVIFARKPGDGSAREQAASCQRVLGGDANIALEYATKRYRSNVINWGMLPFITTPEASELLAIGDYVYLEGVREAVQSGAQTVTAYRVRNGEKTAMPLSLPGLSQEDREIILSGCLINHYASQH